MSASALAAITHRRWAGPVLGALGDPETARTGGARLGALAARFGAARDPIRDAVATLETLGLVQRNPGHGHPLRPEIVLTERGRRLAPGFAELDIRLADLGVVDLGRRKWTLPVLGVVVEGPARFACVARALRPATDRAVSQALTGLVEGALVERSVAHGAPPRWDYGVTDRARPLAELVRELAAGAV